ncbi:putative SP-containing protein [Vairimorpha necatrix]|uniref:SP-containing protein n=1 Tax=Vairimorpha necatrix TaxID=6039 RepID=A0AAX4JCL9_9MICR
MICYFFYIFCIYTASYNIKDIEQVVDDITYKIKNSEEVFYKTVPITREIENVNCALGFSLNSLTYFNKYRIKFIEDLTNIINELKMKKFQKVIFLSENDCLFYDGIDNKEDDDLKNKINDISLGEILQNTIRK